MLDGMVRPAAKARHRYGFREMPARGGKRANPNTRSRQSDPDQPPRSPWTGAAGRQRGGNAPQRRSGVLLPIPANNGSPAVTTPTNRARGCHCAAALHRAASAVSIRPSSIDDNAWPHGICGAVMALEAQDVTVDTLQRRIVQRHRAGHCGKPIGDEFVDEAFRTV